MLLTQSPLFLRAGGFKRSNSLEKESPEDPAFISENPTGSMFDVRWGFTQTVDSIQSDLQIRRLNVV